MKSDKQATQRNWKPGCHVSPTSGSEDSPNWNFQDIGGGGGCLVIGNQVIMEATSLKLEFHFVGRKESSELC